jgi:elongator complex protein 3
MEKLAREIIGEILEGRINDKGDFAREKTRLAGKYGLDSVPRNSDILKFAAEEEYDIILPLLQKKPMRTMSGVAIIAAMTKPHKCPHGKCIYCPGGLDVEVPQSYTGKEPAARRAIMHGYDPYEQVHARLAQLDAIGHPIDKCELITMGGTLPALEYEYQNYFVRECLRAMNDYPKTKKAYGSLENIQETNEKSGVRCVGMTFETRPDYAMESHVDNMLKLGGTKVELGVQTLSDEVYKKVNRGHSVADVAKSTQLCRDALLKVGYQMMPGLFANEKEDVKMFKELFSDARFKPDLLKFYPCLVIKGTELYEMWKAGEYKPYGTEEAAKVLAKIKKSVPPWCRVIRIQRDIPVDLVVDGVVKSNLRELVESEMRAHGDSCKCIRCREVGIKMAKENILPDPESIKLQRIDYDASGGKEVFLSFEETSNKLLIGFLRLRKPSEDAHRPEMQEAAGIRELHVFGPMVEIGEKAREKWQHRGYGKELLAEAERITSEDWELENINVISGIGARDYYRRFGYERKGPYMGKPLVF